MRGALLINELQEKLKIGHSPKLKYFPSISVEGMRKTTKKSVRISRF
jgi:hypothetical protein